MGIKEAIRYMREHGHKMESGTVVVDGITYSYEIKEVEKK